MRVIVAICVFTLMLAKPVFSQVQQIQKLLQILPSIQDSTQYVDALNRLSLLCYEDNADSTLFYSVIAKEIASRRDYPKGMADANNNLGIVYDIKGNNQLALRYYNDAYNQYKVIGDSSNIVQTLMNIAMVYDVIGRKDKAISNYKQALAIGNRISRDSITALAIYNYMLSHPGNFQENEREKYITKARSIALKYNDRRMQLAIDQLQAEGYILNKNFTKGIAQLEQILAKSLQMELFFFSMDLIIQLGDLHLEKDPARATGYFEQALKIAEEKGYRIYARAICNKLYNYYLSVNDNAKAYLYSRKLISLFEEQEEIDRASGIDYIEYAVKDQALKSEQLKSVYNSRLLWLVIAVCVLTILSIVFLWRNWMLTRRTNEVLRLQFRQLESTTEALELTNQSYAKLIKIVAHDLRNPIGAINGISSILLEDDLSATERREFAQLIYDSSTSSTKLIGDLLSTDFNLKESELHKERLNLSQFLEQAVKLLTFQASEKKQELILKDGLTAEVMADRDQLLRVFNNLVVNAIKFSREGETIEINTQQSKGGVEISVKDNGLGIPKETADKIFDPFTSSKREGTAGEQPFGLGLYISKQIIEAHQGKIWFDSEPGKGTTFFVWLPV